MKKIIYLAILLWIGQVCQAQAHKCLTKVDSSQVIRLAKKRGVYWTDNWMCPPKLSLDSLTCKWVLITCKRTHSKKGKCKYTNGCTIVSTATLVVNASTGKADLKKEETVYYNYE